MKYAKKTMPELQIQCGERIQDRNLHNCANVLALQRVLSVSVYLNCIIRWSHDLHNMVAKKQQ